MPCKKKQYRYFRYVWNDGKVCDHANGGNTIYYDTYKAAIADYQKGEMILKEEIQDGQTSKAV